MMSDATSVSVSLLKAHKNQPSLLVGGLTPLTTIDYPGELAAAVFCQGCSWHCCYCHNPELIPRHNAELALEWQDVIAFLKKRQGLLDAVVFSGGEPTLQKALPEAIRQVKDLNFKVGLHSAGCYPDRLKQVLPDIDWLGLDVKDLPEQYSELTGIPGSGAKAWQSLDLALQSGVNLELRITLSPLTDTVKRLQQVVEQLLSKGAARLVIQQSKECLVDRACVTAVEDVRERYADLMDKRIYL